MMQGFDDIAVVPTAALYRKRMYARGGPVWPDFETQTAARHLFDGVPVDLNAEPVDGPHELIERPCVWGGYAHPHFGHFVAEYATRLPVSVQERPDDLYLFTLNPETSPASVPGFFWAVLDWYGIPRAQVQFVVRPMRVSRLHVAPQGEHLRQGAPDAAYLDLIDRNWARNGLHPIASDILYVGRLNQLPQARGGHAGESYLVSVLRRLGVAILDPAVEPLERQLAQYAGARHIVFAEGSAVHARQLIGRVDQRITILDRRPQSEIAKAMLEPRCRQVSHARVTRSLVSPVRRDGTKWRPRGMTFYDVDALIARFRDIGLDLAAYWNGDAFHHAQSADAAAWLGTIATKRGAISLERTRKAATRAFDELGLGHLLDGAARAAQPVRD